jgi:pimeloyl-ACP methyl ester carboxylesterase
MTMKNHSRPVIVFLHGWLMGPWMWTETAKLLGTAVQSELLTQPGHGAPALAPGATMADWAAWLNAGMKARAVERAVLVGHSMGGMLALEMVERYPETVAGLCLVSTTDVPWPVEAQELFLARARVLTGWDRKVAEQTAQALLSKDFIERNPGWLDWWAATVAGYDLANLEHLAGAFAGRSDQRAISSRFDGPAIVMHGTADPVFPTTVGEALAQRLRAPVAPIEGAGHAPPLEAPTQFAAELRGFIAEHFEASDG